MAIDAVTKVIQQIRRSVDRHDCEIQSDDQLLAAFIEQRDEAAFAALVHRHGPMVLGVCRRMLSNQHDAEDVFQATFLVLVRKATSIVPREMVANWLYGVACQTAIRARATNAKRRRREMPTAVLPERETTVSERWDDLQPILDQELSRLPDRYRTPIVLCDLEGKTRKDAARQLGWPEGSVSSRLARGRVMLAKRLTKRGVVFSGGSLAALLSAQATSGGVPATLANATIQSGMAMATGQATAGIATAHVISLTEGTVKGMLLMKLKAVTIVVALGLAVAGIGGWVTYRTAFAHAGETAAVAPARNGNPEPIKEKKADPVAERKKLEGEWEVILAEKDGKIAAANDVKELRIVIRSDDFIARSASGVGRERVSKFKINPAKSPKEIDITSLDGAEAGRTSACIYALEEDGQLRLCMAYFKDFDKRPREFKTQEGDGRMLMVLKRIEDPRKQQNNAAPIAPDDKEIRARIAALAHYWANVQIELNAKSSQKAIDEALRQMERSVQELRDRIAVKDRKPEGRRNQKAEQAAKWLEDNADKIVFIVEGFGSRGAAFSTDKKFVDRHQKGRAFLMTKDEAAGIVQVLLETGLWGRSDPPFLGIPTPARRIGLRAQEGGGDAGGTWTLGGFEDDVSDLLIVKHLIKTFEGDRRKALEQWLTEGLDKKN